MADDAPILTPDMMSDPSKLASGLNTVIRAAMRAGAQELCTQMGYQPMGQVTQLHPHTTAAMRPPAPALPPAGGGYPPQPGYPNGQPAYPPSTGYPGTPSYPGTPPSWPKPDVPSGQRPPQQDTCDVPTKEPKCPPELEWVRPYLLYCERYISLSALARAIELYGWPVIEDELRRGDVNIDVVASPVPAGYKTSFPLAAGEKIRLRQQDGIVLPYWPGTVDVAFEWRAGDPPQPERLTLRWLTGRRDTPTVVHDWIRDHFQKGSLWQCGDTCKTQPFPTRRHCGGGPIGMLSYLYVDIEASATMTSVLEGIDITIHYDEKAAMAMTQACSKGC